MRTVSAIMCVAAARTRPEGGRLTFDVQVRGPIAHNVRNLPLATLMKTRVVHFALADGRGVKIVKCRGEGGHIGVISGAGGV